MQHVHSHWRDRHARHVDGLEGGKSERDHTLMTKNAHRNADSGVDVGEMMESGT